MARAATIRASKTLVGLVIHHDTKGRHYAPDRYHHWIRRMVLVRYLVAGLYTVDQNERAVKTSFGRADRLPKTTLEDPFAEYLREDERSRYTYPQVRVIQPGGPYFKWPWERIHKVSLATQTINMALDPDDPRANNGGNELDAVTKDQLNIGLTGQIRYRVCERNLYAYLFGVKRPIVHVMGYFVSVLRER